MKRKEATGGMIWQDRGFAYRLYPDAKQAAKLWQFIGASRWLWNQFLARNNQRIEGLKPSLEAAGDNKEARKLAWKINGPADKVAMWHWLAALCPRRADTVAKHGAGDPAAAWLRDVPTAVLAATIDDLDRALADFYKAKKGASKKKMPPRFKRREPSGSFTCGATKAANDIRIVADDTNPRFAFVTVPKVGKVRVRYHRPLVGEVCSLTARVVAGKWYVSITTRREVLPPAVVAERQRGPVIGLDMGVAILAAASDGSTYAAHPSLEKIKRKVEKAQRVASRRYESWKANPVRTEPDANGKTRPIFSKRWHKAQAKVAKLQAQLAATRSTRIHQISAAVVSKGADVAIEDLNIRGMTKSAKGNAEEHGKNVKAKAGLNRSILNQGWGNLRLALKYKLEERGKLLLPIDPAYTSQTCHECGTVDKESRKDQATFVCTGCGASHNADVNAAQNIARLGTAERKIILTAPKKSEAA